MRTTNSISGPHRFNARHQSCKWKLISSVAGRLKPKTGVAVLTTFHLGAEHHATKAPWEISAVGGKVRVGGVECGVCHKYQTSLRRDDKWTRMVKVAKPMHREPHLRESYRTA
jgi:hypothetical protein